MKKILLSLGISVLLNLCAVAQDVVPKSVENPNAPIITFVKTTHDYGTIIKGSDGTCEFKFKNTGIEPLILANVSSSCGCTVPDWPRVPVLKGKSASIMVKYATDRIGPINKTIMVISNGIVPSIQLRIVGTVVEQPAGAQMPLNNLNFSGAPVAK